MIEAEPVLPSVVAEMVACPSATDVTSPDALVVAQFSSDEDQLTVLPEISFPFASYALAANCTVSPTDTSDAVAGVTTTELTVGDEGGGFGGPLTTSLPQARNTMLGIRA